MNMARSLRLFPVVSLSATLFLAACASSPQQSIVAEPTACECPDFSAPMSATVLKLQQPKPCPVVKPAPSKPIVEPARTNVNQQSDLLVVGQVENVTVETLKLKFKAKIDSGALFTSINAIDMKHFERDGKKWARFALLHPETGQKVYFELPIVRSKVIKQLSGKYQERPVVLMTLRLGSIKENVEVTLSDRTGYLYQLLIGRNFMENRMMIDVGKSFIVR